MSLRRMLLVGLCGLCAATALAAGSRPVTVSPGDLSRVVPIADTCPTFSWADVTGARAYELVVYRIGEEGEEAEPVLKQVIPGTALSWTPPLESCLERGGRYAWSVRALGRPSPGGQVEDRWSTARLFSSPAKPSLEEVEEALAVLREFVGDNAGRRSVSRPGSLSGAAIFGDLAPPGTPQSVSAGAAGATEPDVEAPPPTEIEGLVSDLDHATLTTWAIHGIGRSEENGSTGVLGEATSESPVASTYGVRGVSHSGAGAGVEGAAWSPTGQTAGVRGFAVSPDGYAGIFETYYSGTGGVYASAAANDYSDLVLGGTSSVHDDGTIRSDPAYGNSDIFIDSNDAVVVRLNHDSGGSDTDHDFWVESGDGTRLFNVDESGQVTVDYNLTVDGAVGGTLVDQGDIDSAVAAALLTHENAYHPVRIFVTSTTYQGNLGGVAGADAKCQARASAAGLPGTFAAWVSGNDSGSSAGLRLNFHSRPYYLPSGHKVADSAGDLMDGTLDHAINYNEFGTQVTTSTTAYTNTYASGNYVGATRDCGESATAWTSNATTSSGGYGLITSATSTWSWTTNAHCANWRRLYCLEQ